MKKKLLFSIILFLFLTACQTGKKTDICLENSAIFEDTKFGAALVDISQEDFEALGFSLGDSCDIVFSNGYELSDVPYYNGYYTRNTNPLICAYPGYDKIRVTLNNCGIWENAELDENDTVTITLAEKGKYSDIQETLGQLYSFDRNDYPSDEAFCNFRSLKGGNLKENFIYRGASPVDNSRNRAAYTDKLLADTGIKFIVDLADCEEDINSYFAAEDFNSPYAKSLYENSSMVLLDMNSDYNSQVYKEKVVEGLRACLNQEGPFYIHCMEGKDRTGFVCVLIEALAGASLDEMKTDYMETYFNYYKVSKTENAEKYAAICDLYFEAFFEYSLKTNSYQEDAMAYLEEGGMTVEEINQFLALITN